MTSQKKYVFIGLLIALSTLLSYVAAEIGYRFFLYNKLKALHTQNYRIGDAHLGNRYITISVYDEYVGYRYVKNQKDITNSHGHVTAKEYTVKKPPGQYRIAVIGDSFTACPFCEGKRSWCEYLEDELGKSSEWKEKIENKETLVINLARDGSGIKQAGRIYEYEGKQFSPDMVLVDFISDDIWRPIYFRGKVKFKSQQELEDAVSQRLNQLQWARFYPFLLADRLGTAVGFAENSATLLNPKKKAYWTPEEGIRASLETLVTMRKDHDNVIVLNHPSLHDLQTKSNDPENNLRKQMFTDFRKQAQILSLKIMYMLDHLPELRAKDVELYTWYSKNDHHPTDIFQRVYAARVAQLIIEQLK